jgi:hypothetical protein
MKKTLLRIVQKMINAIDSESVSSIDDTEESSTCVDIANEAYEFMMAGKRWRHLREFTTLTSSLQLNVLLAPSGTIAIDPKNLYYNQKLIPYVPHEEFIARTQARDETLATITKMGEIRVITDRDPTFWTTTDDETLVFDSVPSAIDGLNADLCQCFLWKLPTVELSDDGDIFDLPTQAFPALQQLCEAWALLDLAKDAGGHDRRMRNYERRLYELSRTGRFIDTEDNLRDKIIARRPKSTRRRITTDN